MFEFRCCVLDCRALLFSLLIVYSIYNTLEKKVSLYHCTNFPSVLLILYSAASSFLGVSSSVKVTVINRLKPQAEKIIAE